MKQKQSATFDNAILKEAVINSLKKLSPQTQWRNPVMFIVYVGAFLVAFITVANFVNGDAERGYFNLQLDLWLWFTVLFANFAEAVAEGRGKAQAQSLRKTRSSVQARKLLPDGSQAMLTSEELRMGDIILVQAGELIPNDGEIIAGMASIDESAVTGESAPVIREAGGDRSAVTGGT